MLSIPAKEIIMLPVLQTKMHDPPNQNGNCLAAAIASILEININDIPKFEDMDKEWWNNLIQFLDKIGFSLAFYSEDIGLPGFYFVMGTSPRNPKINHQVIYKNGKLVHDPHPDGTGILDVKEVWVLVPHDPSKFVSYKKKEM